MAISPQVRLARFLALGLPAALLGGAYVSELGFGLYPCEMCWWPRWPHFAALPLAALGLVAPPARLWTGLAALAILVSGLIGAFHAGVEYGWWEGITSCATADFSADVTSFDSAPWSLFGISLAGWNFLLSGLGAVTILVLLFKQERT